MNNVPKLKTTHIDSFAFKAWQFSKARMKNGARSALLIVVKKSAMNERVSHAHLRQVKQPGKK
jgi:hypothetical protein